MLNGKSGFLVILSGCLVALAGGLLSRGNEVRDVVAVTMFAASGLILAGVVVDGLKRRRRSR